MFRWKSTNPMHYFTLTYTFREHAKKMWIVVESNENLLRRALTGVTVIDQNAAMVQSSTRQMIFSLLFYSVLSMVLCDVPACRVQQLENLLGVTSHGFSWCNKLGISAFGKWLLVS